MNPLKKIPFGLALLPTMASAAWESQIGWESQYISEGRRVTEESRGLFTGLLAYAGGPWFAEAWSGASASGNYQELDASVGGLLEWSGLELGSGYTLVKVWQDGTEAKPDHEWFLGAAYPLTETTEVSVNYVYAYLASGGYLECGLTQWLPTPDGIDLALFGAVAWDFGYASEAFDGISHAHLGIEVGIPVGQAWNGTCFVMVTIPFEDLELDGGTSVETFGLSISRGF